MGIPILILGDSGTGKSTSIRTLPPEKTFIINVINKNLPFKGANKKYIQLSSDGKTGNYYCTDNSDSIIRVIDLVNSKRPEIKYLIIDDMGYTIMNEFVRKAMIKGYDKYSELCKNFSDIINKIQELRNDLFCFVMMHIETDKQGKTKPKTVGNMIDQYICIEGKFTYCFHTHVNEGNYKFITNNDGLHMAKSSLGSFKNLMIDNDLKLITDTIEEYLNEDI